MRQVFRTGITDQTDAETVTASQDADKTNNRCAATNQAHTQLQGVEILAPMQVPKVNRK